MKELVLGGMAGLALGIAGQRLHLHRRSELRCAVGLLAPGLLRSLLLMVGVGAMLTALMMWLAVIDVDTVAVLPLDGGTLIGGVIFGVALGWAGLAPGTAGMLLGAGRLLEGVCAVAGCVAASLLLPHVEPLFAALRGWLQGTGKTWFQVTLGEPYLFAGGFLGQGCIGLAIASAALCIRRAHEDPPEPEPAPPVPDTSAEPEDVQEDAVVVALPGEEPVVVDTGEADQENKEEG